jgi:glycosyltransferase involved in cell wall biosynthesis
MKPDLYTSLLKVFQITLFVCLFPLYSVSDLTFFGYVLPEDGLGKLPLVITEALGDSISINYITTHPTLYSQVEIPASIKKVMENPDRSPGKFALYTSYLPYGNSRLTNENIKKCVIKMAYSMLETTRIPRSWVNILNEEFDAVIVPDPFFISAYENSGVLIPIFVAPIPMRLSSYFERPIHLETPSDPFIFMDASANKNPAVLINAFAAAFGCSSKVHLVMRSGVVSAETRKIVNDVIGRNGLENITIENGFLTESQWIDKLASCDCYINLSRGEGFSLIPREAFALGVPSIITDNTASTTICSTGFVRAVPSNRKGLTSPVYSTLFANQYCGEQFECEVADVTAALRDVFDNYERYIKKAREGREWVAQYNVSHPGLQGIYRALIKPKKVILGRKNELADGTLTTSSPRLYHKYLQIAEDWRDNLTNQEGVFQSQKDKFNWIRFLESAGNHDQTLPFTKFRSECSNC